MEQELLRGLATIFCMLGFAAVVYWAYAPSNKGRFEEDARLAFNWEESATKKRHASPQPADTTVSQHERGADQ